MGIVIGGPFLVLAIVGLTIQLVYQWLSFLKKGDTPGRDVGDVFAGFLVAVVVFVLWLLRPTKGGEEHESMLLLRGVWRSHGDVAWRPAARCMLGVLAMDKF